MQFKTLKRGLFYSDSRRCYLAIGAPYPTRYRKFFYYLHSLVSTLGIASPRPGRAWPSWGPNDDEMNMEKWMLLLRYDRSISSADDV